MLWWTIIAGLNAGIIFAALRVGRRANPRAALGRFALWCAGVLCASIFVGIALGVRAALSATGGESLDPSQKARVLGQGIAEAVNSTAFGVLVFSVPTVTAFVLFLRSPRARNSSPKERQ